MIQLQVCTLSLKVHFATAGWLLRAMILARSCYCQAVAVIKSFCHNIVNRTTGNRKTQLAQSLANFFSLKLQQGAYNLLFIGPNYPQQKSREYFTFQLVNKHLLLFTSKKYREILCCGFVSVTPTSYFVYMSLVIV